MQKGSMKKFIFLFGFLLLSIQCCKNTKEKQIIAAISQQGKSGKKDTTYWAYSASIQQTL